jgi:hypothetical protein
MPLLFPVQTPLIIWPYNSLKRGISTCLHYFLYRRLSVHVHTEALGDASVHDSIISYTDPSIYVHIAALRKASVHTYIISYIDASHYLSI